MANIASIASPYEIASVDAISSISPARFPVPPTTWAYLSDVDINMLPITTLQSTLNGVLLTEGPYLEATVGQIWPR